MQAKLKESGLNHFFNMAKRFGSIINDQDANPKERKRRFAELNDAFIQLKTDMLPESKKATAHKIYETQLRMAEEAGLREAS